jgi:hypothetical protein
VGKTALLRYLVDRASGYRVVRVVGVQSEMELAFAGLHQMLTPMLDRLEHLPGPQREALRTAFGANAGSPPDRFFVALAVLSLLSEVAEEQPLLCVVDDEQWLDRASAQVLAFVARRLGAESVGLVIAARQASAELAGLPELVVEGLDEADARALLDSAVPGPLDERVRDQIVSERREAIRSRCWSSHADSHRRSWPAVSGFSGGCPSRRASRRASDVGSRLCRSRPGA